ncbi:dihydroxyacetone (glycerone) kinase, DhaK2 subunit [Metamycoplasma arthritidis]|uniref:Predicted kinase, related to dihydroxyacetone kinase n=1 Tax=Metamycoplasma arthritidis (strain 158L3-1) TaxID=243272 RepID=B3PN92_META1|nr:DAK2 domain-containing protein [Metamycoplasma arthritidis]ACF07494.1 predicted kinase, related to dihydroxyacetone kinase [Metamycoplasma arthritidis 158L3-1]VEU79015.1 dihydroxyacetone (glycerone) kinase, DhaK2 subunit [Metamycoplasma arthritidis]
MNKINGMHWKNALISAANNIKNKKDAINALNVFPVPDGDTGSNMASTIIAARDAILNLNEKNLEAVGKVVSQSMLMNARGNSGVILSQIFKGFANAFKNKTEISVFDMVNAFEEASKAAYRAVLKPVEGTILTVIREIAEGLKETVVVESTFEDIFNLALEYARKSCDNTPNLLAILKEVGVTDSGGEGLYAIIEGMSLFFQNKAVIETKTSSESIGTFISDSEVFNGEFGYCTEFILELKNYRKFDKESLVKRLEKIGNSMVVVQDEEILKVHIHAKKPGDVLNAVNSLGQFLKIKIDNMTVQASSSKEVASKLASPDATTPKKTYSKKCALISCNVGQGIIELVKQNGVSYVIEGGQTNNPSTQDIVKAADAVDSKTVFILTNNSNIILSAQQASTIVTDKKIITIPTKSQAQCLSVAMNFNEDASEEENLETMKEAMKNVKYGEIAPSVKNTKLNGIKIKEGDFMVMANNEITATAKTSMDAAINLLHTLVDEDSQIVTIFYGQDVSESDSKILQNYIEVNFDVEIEIYSGGQSIYPYFIAVE